MLWTPAELSFGPSFSLGAADNSCGVSQTKAREGGVDVRELGSMSAPHLFQGRSRPLPSAPTASGSLKPHPESALVRSFDFRTACVRSKSTAKNLMTRSRCVSSVPSRCFI
jgi:hypothetical protein